jgi:hypothetical protein
MVLMVLMGAAGGRKRYTQNFGVEIRKGKGNMGDIGVHETVILTLWCLTTHIGVVPHLQPLNVAFYIFIQQI